MRWRILNCILQFVWWNSVKKIEEYIFVWKIVITTSSKLGPEECENHFGLLKLSVESKYQISLKNTNRIHLIDIHLRFVEKNDELVQ